MGLSQSVVRSVAFAFAVAVCVALAALQVGRAKSAGGTRSSQAAVTLRELPGGAWRVTYDLPRDVAQLDLGPNFGDYRARAWRVRTGGVEIAVEEGRDVVRPIDRRRRFNTISFDVSKAAIGLPRVYETFTPLGANGALIFTGHFQPWSGDGARRPIAFNVEPLDGRFVSVFDEVTPRLENWRSRFDNPAFLYIGDAPSMRGPGLVGVVDSATPDWVAQEVGAFAPEVIGYLSARFGWTLQATPNLFVSYGGDETPGRAMFEGDALPAQFRIGLRGGAWERRSPFAEHILRAGVAHEAAHLWQTAARPFSEDAPDWIHEGGADSIAAETLVALGWWGAQDLRRRRHMAKAACFRMLRGVSLPALEARGEIAASYDCGQTINDLAARAHPEGAIGFWKDFISRARAEGGYDADLFFEVAGEHGGPQFADALRRFAILPQARPSEALLAVEAALDSRSATRSAAGSIAKAGDH